MNEQKDRALRRQGFGLIGGLALQYMLGMYVDLFISFPEGVSEGEQWQFAWSQPALVAHIILALLLFMGSIALCIRAARAHNRQWIIASGIGLLAIFAAAASGGQFIPTQSDPYSYSMAIAFIVAVLAYGWGLYVSGKKGEIV